MLRACSSPCVGENLPAGKLGRTNLRDRTEQSAELLVSAVGHEASEELIDRVTNILLALPHRVPELEEAKLLADALNLDDFGVVGLRQPRHPARPTGRGRQPGRRGRGKREEYGYWEARLKDGFHFEPVRRLARQRLEQMRQVAKLLKDELDGDVP